VSSNLGRSIVFNQAVNQQSVTVPGYKQTAGEYPDPNFPFLRDIYLKDTDVYTAVNFITNRAISRGYHIECDANAPNYLKTECEEYLTDFLEYVRWGDRRNERGFKPLAKTMLQEMGYAGTTILEEIDPEKISAFASVPPSSVWKFQRDYTGQLVGIWQYPHINPTPLSPDRYAIFRWNTVDRNPWGYGLAHSLAYPRVGPRGELIPPVILSWWQMQDDARLRLHRYAVPRSIFGVKGISLNEAKDMAETMKDPEASASIITNAEVGVAMDSPTARGNFAPEFDLIRNRVDIGLNAMLSVILASDKKFAYSSARVGQDISDIIVWDLQQNFKSTTENEILAPIAEQAGFDTNLLRPSFEYNIPDEPQEYTVADILNAVKVIDPATGLPLISIQEARDTLKQLVQWPLDETMQATPTMMPGQLITNPQPTQSPMPPQAQGMMGGRRFSEDREIGVYKDKAWLAKDYRVDVNGETIDITKMSDQEFKQFMLWRLGAGAEKPQKKKAR